MNQAEEEVSALIEGLGYNAVEVHIGKQRRSLSVRAVIYKEGGIGINNCAEVHQVLQPRLEVLFKDESIFVEVTSPGTSRVFKKNTEYPIFIGRYIKILLKNNSDWIEGKLLDANEETLTIQEHEGEEKKILMSEITKGKLDGLKESSEL